MAPCLHWKISACTHAQLSCEAVLCQQGRRERLWQSLANHSCCESAICESGTSTSRGHESLAPVQQLMLVAPNAAKGCHAIIIPHFPQFTLPSIVQEPHACHLQLKWHGKRAQQLYASSLRMKRQLKRHIHANEKRTPFHTPGACTLSEMGQYVKVTRSHQLYTMSCYIYQLRHLNLCTQTC